MRIHIASALLLCPTLALADGSIRVTAADGQTTVAASSKTQDVRHVKARRLKAGEVLFHLRDADLATEVLPLLEEQAGVRLRFDGTSRPVTLRLVQPVHWTTALDLLCRFGDVHVTKNYTGQIVVRDQYGGSLGDREDWSDVKASLSADAAAALTTRENEARARRASKYNEIRARQVKVNAQSRFHGTTATSGFGWRGGTAPAIYTRGTYARAQRVAPVRARGQRARGTYSRGTYSRGPRVQANIQRGTYTRGNRAPGPRAQATRQAPNRTRGQYSRGNRIPGNRSAPNR